MSKKCVYCRNDMGVYTTKCPHCNSEQPPEQKKPSLILGCGGVFFTFCFALLGFAYCTPHDNKPATDSEPSQIEEHIPPAPKETEKRFNSTASIHSHKFKSDGVNNYLIVTYIFDNREGTEASFLDTFVTSAYQSDVECPMDRTNKICSMEKQTNLIKNSSSATIDVAYVLNDASDVTVKVFKDDKEMNSMTYSVDDKIADGFESESPAPAEQPTEAPTEAVTEAPTEAPKDNSAAGSEVLYDDGEVRITYTGNITESWMGMFEIHVLVENMGSRTLCVQTDSFSINGYMFEPIFSCEVAPGKKRNDTISVFLEDNNLTFADVTEAETKFHIFDWDDWGYSKDTDYISFGF